MLDSKPEDPDYVVGCKQQVLSWGNKMCNDQNKMMRGKLLKDSINKQFDFSSVNENLSLSFKLIKTYWPD